MASPLDALGSAAAILQLIDYGIKLSSKAAEIHRSSQGLTRQAEVTQDMSIKFKIMNDDLIARYDRESSTVSASEKDVERTARECDLVAVSLLEKLEELRAKDSRKIAKSLIKAFVTERQQKDIDQHRKRLKNLRQLLNEQILRLVSDQTNATATALRQLDERTSGLASDLSRYKTELLDAIRHANHSRVSEALVKVYNEGEAMMVRQRILASLRFDDMRLRWDRIEEPTEATYDWIFDPSRNQGPPIRFTDWLESGSDLFWINGKAGSGKSTLMKHICNSAQTRKGLESWAGERRLVMASHHFWYLGTPLQRSYEGLLRSILFDALSKCPELIDVVCEARHRRDTAGCRSPSDPWTLSELRQCIMLLASSTDPLSKDACCFCFFIDGLDEYDGEHDEIVRLLRDIAKAGNIKVCVSSRPWEVFQESFAKSTELGDIIILQEHTGPDIARFIKHEISEIPVKGHKAAEDLDLIEAEIVRKAQGVFLWVALVVRKELKHGLLYADDIELIRKRLEQVPAGDRPSGELFLRYPLTQPAELEDYFKLIFERIDPIYRQETARIFLTCMQATEPLPIHVVPLIISDEPADVARNAKMDREYRWEDEALFEQVRKQVNGRCQDLLEIDPPTIRTLQTEGSRTDMHRIQFLHRSVADYLGQRDVRSMLCERAGVSYGVRTVLLAAYVFLIKKSASVDVQGGREYVLDWSTSALEHAADMDSTPSGKALLKELDESMNSLYDRPLHPKHWTNYYHHTTHDNAVLSDEYLHEYGDRDFLGHLIELDIAEYAQAMLKEHPQCLTEKKGRPYLDYALRSTRLTRRMTMSGLRPNVRSVELILSLGARATDRVWIYHGRTVWDLYVSYLYEVGEDNDESREVAWMLIRSGATEFPCRVSPIVVSTARHRAGADPSASLSEPTSMRDLLQTVFGPEEGLAMSEAVAKNRAAKGFSAGWKAVLRGLWK